MSDGNVRHNDDHGKRGRENRRDRRRGFNNNRSKLKSRNDDKTLEGENQKEVSFYFKEIRKNPGLNLEVLHRENTRSSIWRQE